MKEEITRIIRKYLKINKNENNVRKLMRHRESSDKKEIYSYKGLRFKKRSVINILNLQLKELDKKEGQSKPRASRKKGSNKN